MSRKLLEIFNENYRGFIREYRWFIAIFTIAILCDAASTIHFMLRIGPDSEIAGYVWINIWPDFCIGNDWTFNTDADINYLKEPFFPRYSFEGSVIDLKSSTFNLILPIDFGEHVRNYMFTFKIDDVI